MKLRRKSSLIFTKIPSVFPVKYKYLAELIFVLLSFLRVIPEELVWNSNQCTLII